MDNDRVFEIAREEFHRLIRRWNLREETFSADIVAEYALWNDRVAIVTAYEKIRTEELVCDLMPPDNRPSQRFVSTGEIVTLRRLIELRHGELPERFLWLGSGRVYEEALRCAFAEAAGWIDRLAGDLIASGFTERARNELFDRAP